jgi:hypothetical protein
LNKETQEQPDIKDIIKVAEGLAGNMTFLAKDLGMSRQALYIIIQKGRCRVTTRLLLKQYIMLRQLGLRKKKSIMKSRKFNGRVKRGTAKDAGRAGKGNPGAAKKAQSAGNAA